VKSIVELHGGTVTCESPGLDKGSRFTVRLPRAAATAATTTGQTTSAMGLGTSAPLRIMVVDDNVDAASLMSMLLEATGHQIEVQHDARTALERSAADPPQVFLLDIGLPEIDGIELARRLRAQPGTADAVLIAITGYGQAEDRARTAAAGFSHHLTKPVDIDELYAILAGTASKLSVLQRFGDRRLFSSR
jgi:CheY-like chemotaxis protein